MSSILNIDSGWLSDKDCSLEAIPYIENLWRWRRRIDEIELREFCEKKLALVVGTELELPTVSFNFVLFPYNCQVTCSVANDPGTFEIMKYSKYTRCVEFDTGTPDPLWFDNFKMYRISFETYNILKEKYSD